MSKSPFKLLEPYSAKDKNSFFGRDAEIFALYNLLQKTRLVLVYGASGTGKTSLIHAGLPKVFKLTDWFRLSIRRRDDINKSLQSELAKHIDNNTPTTDLPKAINAVFESRWIPVYLVFDQFEEIFTLGDAEERREFFTNLQIILNQNLPCKVILSMREEYIGHLYEYEPLVPTLFEQRFRVEPMKDETVRSVVSLMCDNYDITLESGTTTVKQILEQVKEGKQAVHLPYLQIYLHYLYEKATRDFGFGISDLGDTQPKSQIRNPIFTEGVIGEVGKLGNVLKTFINTKIEEAQQFFQAQKLKVPSDFAAKLLDEFATDEGTKRSRKADELAKVLNTEGGIVKQALVYFDEKAKLLRADEDEVERYEPVHDVVAKQIHELRSAEDKEFKAFTRQLQNDYEAWQRDKQAKERLLNELDLNKVMIYETRLKNLPEYINTLSSFIKKSQAHIDELKRQERRRRNTLITITLLALIGLGIATWQYFEARNANRNVVYMLMREADKSILNLDYEGALEKCRTALVLDVNKDTIDTHLLEIAFVYTEADKLENAISVVNLIKRLDFTAETPNATQKIKREIESICTQNYFNFLQMRYYPKMIDIEGGKFTMGCTDSDCNDPALKNAMPTHQVQVDNFRMSETEITFWQFNLYALKNPSFKYRPPQWGLNGSHPVVNITIKEAKLYLDWLSQKFNPPFRLPTEAEWEFAARGGKNSLSFTYSGSNQIDDVGWYAENPDAKFKTYEVKKKQKNELGLFDMTGNVWEYCLDTYDENFYARGYKINNVIKNPINIANGSQVVNRGGDFRSDSLQCKLYYRQHCDTSEASEGNCGFRCINPNK